MTDERSWWVVRKCLLQAASDKVAKGGSVADLLYIPESFTLEKKDEITRSRMAIFNPLAKADGSTRKLMMVVQEATARAHRGKHPRSVDVGYG